MKSVARLAVVTLLSMLAVSSLGCPKPPIQATVPATVGLSRSAAETAITDAGLAVGTVSEAYSGAVASGYVISQSLLAGMSVTAGMAMDLVVSLGPDPAFVCGAIPDVTNTDTVPASEISEDETGKRVVRTKLTIVFYPTATAAEMDALLDSLGAEITCSLAGTRSIVVRIPDSGDLLAYAAIVASIEAEPYVQFVIPGEMPEPQMLPDNYYTDPPDVNELTHLDHHLAVRAYAAWNAKGAIRHDPQVLVVVDRFGAGPPVNNTVDYYGGMSPDGTPDFSTAGLNSHGYHVLGIIAGTFGQYYATGMFPGTVALRVVDLQVGMDWGTAMHETLRILRDEMHANVIVNASIGYTCDGTGGDCIDIGQARLWASLWVEYARWFGLEDRVLHVTAANNIRTPPGPTIHDARTASPFASARLLEDLTDSLGTPMSNLSNTLVVENARNYLADAEYVPSMQCLDASSFTGGDLSGFGTEVWSFLDPSGTQDDLSGTSMATPQVAGLVAYLWSIDPNPTPQQLVTLLLSTSEPILVLGGVPGCSECPTPAPVIDAYSAMLALDAAAPPTPENSPVRHAILDVDDDGDFDEDDVAQFILKYYESPGCGSEVIDPANPDYGRFDLNGDGWTGGGGTFPFDLDRTGSVQYGPSVFSGTVTQTIGDIDVSYNENQIRDMDALCYYAYSDLYQGDTSARDDALKCRCAPAMKVYAASDNIEEGEDPSFFPNNMGFGEVVGLVRGTDTIVWHHAPAEGLPAAVRPPGQCRVTSPLEFLPGTTIYHGVSMGGASAGVTVDFAGSGDSVSLDFETRSQGNSTYGPLDAALGVDFYLEIANGSTGDMTLEITYDLDVAYTRPEDTCGESYALVGGYMWFACGGNDSYPVGEYIPYDRYPSESQPLDSESTAPHGYSRGTSTLAIRPGYSTLYIHTVGQSTAYGDCGPVASTRRILGFRLLP